MEEERIEFVEIILFGDRRGACQVRVTRASYIDGQFNDLIKERSYGNVSGYSIARLLNAFPIKPPEIKLFPVEEVM